MRTYYWCDNAKKGSQEDAQVVGELLEAIGGKAGEDPTSDVLGEFVRRSEPEDAPTHKYFEWDDAVAGNLYRREQGRRIIRMVMVEVVVNEQTVRKQRFMESLRVSKDDEEGQSAGRQYVSIDQIKADPKLATVMLRQALNELITFQNKWKQYREVYKEFGELDRVNDAISQLKLKFNPRPGMLVEEEAASQDEAAG